MQRKENQITEQPACTKSLQPATSEAAIAPNASTTQFRVGLHCDVVNGAFVSTPLAFITPGPVELRLR